MALVTHREDLTADWLVLELRRRGASFVRVNSEDFPSRLTITWSAEGATLEGDHLQLKADELRAVWWRRSVAPVMELGERSAAEQTWALGEADAAWQGFWRTVEARWVNHPDANAAADHKLVQLRAARALGLRVPDTLVTNDPLAAQRFAARKGSVVCKALRGGVIPGAADADGGLLYTQELDEGVRSRLEELGPEPYLLQETIAKRADVRVTVIGRQVFACRIASQEAPGAQTDWRAGELEDLAHEPLELPDALAEACCALARRFGLRFAAIDLAIDTEGGWAFFEVNPNGQWAWTEQLTGQPVAAALADELSGSGHA